MRTPRAASAAISSAGRGSTTAIFCGSSPSASQPCSIAPPILPAPTSTSVPEKSLSVDMSTSPSLRGPRTGSARMAGPMKTPRVARSVSPEIHNRSHT